MADLLDQAEHLIALHHLDEADRLIDQALAEDPQSPLAHTLRAHIQIQREDWSGARQSARVVLASMPDCPHTHGLLALAVLQDVEYTPERRVSQWLGLRSGESVRLAEALHHIDHAIELSADAAHLHGVRALVLLEREDYRNALAAANAGIGIDPTDSTCSTARHEAMVRLGMHEQAAQYTSEALQTDPENKYAHVQLGRLALWRGEFDKAFEHAKAALQTDPHFETAQSIYWTAAAHLSPAVRPLANISGLFLRKLDLPLRVVRASPFSTISALVIAFFALVLLARSSFRRGDFIIGWGTIVLLTVPVVMIVIPILIWALLHVLLFIRSRDRRAAISGNGWLGMGAAGVLIASYVSLFYIVPNRPRPPFFVPPLLAICPMISLVFSAGEGWLKRILFLSVAGITTVLAIGAVISAFKGDREGPQIFLLAAGAITFFADFAISYVERSGRHRGKASPNGDASSKLSSRVR